MSQRDESETTDQHDDETTVSVKEGVDLFISPEEWKRRVDGDMRPRYGYTAVFVLIIAVAYGALIHLLHRVREVLL